MLGNCAVGRLSIATTPTRTIRMEIHMATIGRLIKNLGMVSCPLPPAVAGRNVRLGDHRDARLGQLRRLGRSHLQLQQPIDHHSLAGL